MVIEWERTVDPIGSGSGELSILTIISISNQMDLHIEIISGGILSINSVQ